MSVKEPRRPLLHWRLVGVGMPTIGLISIGVECAPEGWFGGRVGLAKEAGELVGWHHIKYLRLFLFCPFGG